jgi:class 3 adenylate cyclase/FixJ family two-component response regulator
MAKASFPTAMALLFFAYYRRQPGITEEFLEKKVVEVCLLILLTSAALYVVLGVVKKRTRPVTATRCTNSFPRQQQQQVQVVATRTTSTLRVRCPDLIKSENCPSEYPAVDPACVSPCRRAPLRSPSFKWEVSTGSAPGVALEILIVEDDLVQQKVATRMLQKLSFNVVAVMTAEDALVLLSERDASGSSFPDMVLMDYNLPGMSGLDAVRLIRKRYPAAALPILMATGVEDEDEEVLCMSLQAGCNDFVRKPLKSSALSTRISVHLRVLGYWRFQISSRKSEALLREFLPPTIIKRYRRRSGPITDAHAMVSILFTEIVDFAALELDIGCRASMSLLHRLFCCFDDLTDKHEVYKVETVGDTYMVMAGHEVETSESHARRLAAVACDMLEAATHIKLPSGDSLKLRVGIHTGAAYSGVIGHKCPRYCVFGDTVNTASRMKSTCFPNCIQISHATYLRLFNPVEVAAASSAAEVSGLPGGEATMPEGALVAHSHAQLYRTQFYDLGLRNIKGKGAMQTWLLPFGDAEHAAAAHYKSARPPAYQRVSLLKHGVKTPGTYR